DSIIPRISNLFKIDNNLRFFQRDLELRYQCFLDSLKEIENNEKNGLDGFSNSYIKFGLNLKKNGIIKCREWIPGAKHVSLVGDFNYWNENANPLKLNEFGIWKCKIVPENTDKPVIQHLSKIKLCITTKNNIKLYKLSPWSKYNIQNSQTKLLESCFYNPPQKYQWKYDWPLKAGSCDSLRIYEAHVGISSEDYIVASYRHFKEQVLPHVVYLGYNSIQLMAIMEHAYYASFGYQ
ncbi:hypothetical protein MXB_5403, partial [Myxobolus squamalis]